MQWTATFSWMVQGWKYLNWAAIQDDNTVLQLISLVQTWPNDTTFSISVSEQPAVQFYGSYAGLHKESAMRRAHLSRSSTSLFVPH